MLAFASVKSRQARAALLGAPPEPRWPSWLVALDGLLVVVLVGVVALAA